MTLNQAIVSKIKYYSNVTGLNLLALLFLWFTLNPLFIHHSSQIVFAQSPIKESKSVSSNVKVISGIPVRIVISPLYIDLPVDKGTYDPTTDTWTLHDLKAYYAVYSSPANNIGGN